MISSRWGSRPVNSKSRPRTFYPYSSSWRQSFVQIILQSAGPRSLVAMQQRPGLGKKRGGFAARPSLVGRDESDQFVLQRMPPRLRRTVSPCHLAEWPMLIKLPPAIPPGRLPGAASVRRENPRTGGEDHTPLSISPRVATPAVRASGVHVRVDLDILGPAEDAGRGLRQHRPFAVLSSPPMVWRISQRLVVQCGAVATFSVRGAPRQRAPACRRWTGSCAHQHGGPD